MRSPGGPDASGSKSNQRIIQREPSGEYDDDDDQYEYSGSSKIDGLQHKMGDVHLDDDFLPDTTMLDSVILPAIASVCFSSHSTLAVSDAHISSCSLESPRRKRGWHLAPSNGPSQRPKESFLV